MRVIQFLGLSKGSFSPDYTLARPYGLALAYLVLLITIAAVALWRWRRTARPQVLLLAALFTAATIDYVCTLFFAATRWLTIY